MIQPSKRQISAGHFRLINGIWHKRCTGAAHDEPVWLPATEKYFYRRKSNAKRRQGELVSRCRLCCNWNGISPGTAPGLVPATDVIHFYREAVARVGLMEFSRRVGMHYTSIENVLDGRVTVVRKSSLRKVMLELISMRRKGEYSINNRARWRNQRRLTPVETACGECGTRLENFTEGCGTCVDRKYSRDRRAKRTDEEAAEIRAADRRRKRLKRTKQAA